MPPSILTRLRSSWKSTRSSWKSNRSALLPTGATISSIPLLDMLAHNWYLGLTSFGGPTVHFQIFQQLFVERYKWIDAATYQEMFALCQALSGPGSTKMIYAINVLHYGLLVGIASFFLWSLPMAIAAFALGLGVGNIGDELPGPVYALLSGLNSATVGIIALAAVQLSNKAITDTLTRCLVFLAGTAGMLYNALWYFPVLMAAGGIVTVIFDLKLVQRTWRKISPRKEAPPTEDVHHGAIEMGSIHHSAEPQASISNLHARSSAAKTPTESAPTSADHQSTLAEEISTPPKPALSSWKLATALITAFFASFITVMVCRGTFGGQNRGFDLFSNLYLAGTIIFGGGPVVIPLLREYIVTPGFASPRDFILGLAITQAFPGPNFNFAVYCGTLAVQGSGIPPVVGAMIGYIGIFLPGLWLHTAFIGLWSTVRKVQVVRALLRGIHATAVGLVFTAVYRIFQIGYLDGENQNGASLSRDPWWLVVVATSFVGGMHFGVSPPMAVLLGSVMGLVWFGVTQG
ncbi:chromate ion transporter like protein [Zymoseptoria brevis]|uniref:Chromate ion transporter like protein n=1 Tax=Zymoseptoria brevis TaxID=1047168 RepID=A0A0F4G7R2_9PEZI|nr:chromate ion transporter like protein [Zymoseptoria brevis]